MEQPPPPPFLDHPPRYVPLPHHRPPPQPNLSIDLNFYQQQQQLLPPPPPLPPLYRPFADPSSPRQPPYNHQSHFPFPNHRPIEENHLRIPHLLLQPPPPPPPLPHRVFNPKFDNCFPISPSGSWMDPPPDNQIYFDNPRHLLDSTLRFRDDFSDVGSKPDRGDEFLRSTNDVDSSYGCRYHLYDSHSSGSFRNFGFDDSHVCSPGKSRGFGSTVGSFESFRGFALDNDRIRSNSRDENRRWDGLARPPSRNSSDVCSVDGENEDFDNSHGLQVGLSRRVSNVYDSGKFRGSREGSQEFRQSRKERRSALLRIQSRKSTKRNRNGEQKFPSLCSNDSGSSTIRSRGTVAHTGVRVEQDGEGSPVELDVSFKSNALVAKAIVASPSHGVESSRKLPGQEIDHSNSPLNKLNSSDHSNSPLNKLNSSAYGFDCLAISYEESKQSEPSLHHAIESPGKNMMKEPVSDKGVYKVGSVGTSSLRVKKKKVNSHLLRSQAMEKNVDLVEENRSINGPPTASQVGEDGMHSMERSISAGMILVQNVDMQPSPNEVTAFLDHIVGNYTAGSIVSNKGGSDVDPGGSHVHNSNKTRNSSTSPGSSNPLIITVDEGTVIADTSIDLRTISNYAEGPAELQNRSTYTGSGLVGDFRHQSCEIEPPVFLQNGFLKGQLEADDSSSLVEIKSHGVLENLLATVGDVHNDSSSDNVLIRGQVKIKVSDIDAVGTGSKFNEATVLAGSDYVEGIPRAVPIVESKAIVCLSSAEETSIQEGVSDGYSSNDSATTTSGSDNGLSNSQSKFSFSGIGYLGDTNKESGPVTATVLLENVALGGAPKARIAVGGDLNSGFEKGRPSNERKNSSYPFPSPISSDMSENAFTVLDPVDTLSFPAMDLNFAETDVLGAGSFSAGSQCCTDEDRILCGYSPIKVNFDNDISGKGSFRISQKGSFPKYMKKRKISAPVSALPILSLTEEESTNAGTFTSGVELPSLRSMVSNIQQVGSSRFPNCSESYPVLLGNTNPGASFEALGFCNNVSELEQKEQSDLVMTIENGFCTEIGGRGKSVEEPGMLQIENVQQKNPEEIQTLDSDQKLPLTDVECEADLFVKNGFPSVSNIPSFSNIPSLYEHDDGFSTTHLHDVVVESATDKLLNMEATRPLSTVTGSKIVTLGQVSNDKGCFDERNQDENLVPEDLFSLSLSNTSLQNTTTGKKPGHVVGIVSSTTKVGPQDARKTTHGLNSRNGVINKRKDQLASVVPSTFPGHLLKKTAPSSHRTKPRTWHRTANPSTSSHLGKSSYTNPLPPQGQQGKNTGKDQTAAYIRKGNSLVRNPSPVAATSIVSPCLTSSVYRLCPLTVNKMKDKTGLDASLERPKTPPLPGSTKLSNCMTSSPLADPLSNGCSETDSDPLTIRVNADVPKFSDDTPNSTGTSEYRNGQINNSVSKSVQDDSNSVSRESKKIVYVKRKSNQLVAAPGSSDLSHQNVDKTENPSSSGYYKRRKNQIIRKSFEVTPKVGLHEELLEGKKALPVTGNSSSRRRSGKGLGKTYKSSKSSLVWTLCGAQSLKKENTLVHQVRPHLFPWKRATYRRSLMHTSASVSTNTSLSTISRKLLLSRKRETIYTRSTQGFSLRKSKVLSVGGASLKWSKSIERKLKEANEEATLAVVAVEKKKREQNGAGAVTAGAKNRNRSSRKLVHSIELRPGERIFRVGSIRYKMDPTRRTLQRISDEELSNSAALQPGVKKSAVPKRLVIGNDEYVRIGNGNQLIRDPRKRTRILASEKVRWSLHNARLRMARKRKYCQFFTRFGKCNKDDGKCPYIHDPSKIAVCTKFLKGSCFDINCKLTHKAIPERMQDCSYFLQGLCTNESCPYRHVNVNQNASICEGFLRGYCADGNECQKKHSYVCPTFEATGICTQGSKCKLHHPKNRNKGKKTNTSKEQKNTRGRYFGSKHINILDSRTTVSEKHSAKDSYDIFDPEGRFADYIDLGFYDEEATECNDLAGKQTTAYGDDGPKDIHQDDDELIKPINLMSRTLMKESPQALDSPRN